MIFPCIFPVSTVRSPFIFSNAGSWTSGLTTVASGRRGFVLIGFDRSMLARNSGEITEISINYLGGKARIGTGTIEGQSAQQRVVKTAETASTAHRGDW